MAVLQKFIGKLVNGVDVRYAVLKHRLRERSGGRAPIVIIAFRGYGTSRMLYLKGRVLEDQGIGAARVDDSTWDNVVNMIKRFSSVEIPYARVRARFQNVEQEVVADEEGYFDVWIAPAGPLSADSLWQEIELELVAPLRAGAIPVHTIAAVLVPPPDARYGVISDVDDTVLHTDAFNLLRMARTVFLGNARTRLPLKGAAAFYRALFRGYRQTSINPLFFISNSPWNLYDLLSEFFHLHDIPIGPILFLRSWGFTRKEQLPMRKREHKLASARTILALFPHLPFILIGDSGEKDPEIYTDLVSMYPERISAVYIRKVGRNLKRPVQITALAEKVNQTGSALVLADDTYLLAQHAVQHGWIAPESLAEIDADREKDAEPVDPLAQLLGTE